MSDTPQRQSKDRTVLKIVAVVLMALTGLAILLLATCFALFSAFR